ncbi:MAG: enoyl-CoA hydratase-related protein [Saprospiraceae bacterium]
MNLYTKKQTKQIFSHHFAYLEVREEDHVLKLTLDRAEKKNALHPQLINELAFALHYAHYEQDIWIIEIGAKGNVFCAGADLKAMAGIIEKNDSTVPLPNGEILIGELFNKVYKPTIAKITGDVYAGGFFFLAGCNIVIAQKDLKFGLPEVKRGLYPFQVMAALLKVMPERKVIDWCIRGYNLAVDEAERYGLVTTVVSKEEIDKEVARVISELKQNSPSAIKKGLEAYDRICPSAPAHKYLFKMLQDTIASNDGIEGLKAFREKRKPVWSGN